MFTNFLRYKIETLNAFEGPSPSKVIFQKDIFFFIAVVTLFPKQVISIFYDNLTAASSEERHFHWTITI